MKTKKLVTFLLSLLLISLQNVFCMGSGDIIPLEIPASIKQYEDMQRKKNTEQVNEFIAGLITGNENYGSKLLFNAIVFNTYETMLELLKYGVNVNSYKNDDTSILERACNLIKDIKKVRLLLKYGANFTLNKYKASTVTQFARNNNFAIRSTNIPETILSETAQENWIHMSKNEFDKVLTTIFEKYPDELSLFYNVLFALRFKKQFKELEFIIQQKLRENFGEKFHLKLKDFLLETGSPQLLQHFLERGIFKWNDDMFNKFLRLQDKKDMTLLYQYNSTSTEKTPYDIHIICGTTKAKRKFNQVDC